MKTAKADIVGAAVCALFGVAVWVATDKTVRGDGLGLFHTDARLFPHFIAFMIVGVSLAWLAKSLWSLRAPRETPDAAPERPPIDWGAAGRVFLFILLFFAYVLALRPLGFILSSLLAGQAALVILRERRPAIYVSVAGCALLLYVVFQYLLRVRLP